jgi:monoamine oxidase
MFPKAFAALLGNRISYGAEVVSITHDANGVTLSVRSGGALQQLTGDYAICTLPFSVLRTIPVSPAFSAAKQHAINSLRYTSTVRVFLEFSHQFWLDENLNGLVITDLPIGIVYPQPDQPGPGGILNIVMAGDFARGMAARSDSDRVRFTLNEIKKFFPQAEQYYIGGGSKDWDDDPYARGAYPWYAPGEMTSLLPANAQSEGRIHFAGDHVSTLPGWIEGALASGQYAAQSIAQLASAPSATPQPKAFGKTPSN